MLYIIGNSKNSLQLKFISVLSLQTFSFCGQVLLLLAPMNLLVHIMLAYLMDPVHAENTFFPVRDQHNLRHASLGNNSIESVTKLQMLLTYISRDPAERKRPHGSLFGDLFSDVIKCSQRLTFPQLMYSTAVSRKKKYTKSPCVMELTKFGAGIKENQRYGYNTARDMTFSKTT